EVPQKTEGSAPFHHLGHPEAWPHRREDPVRDRAERGPDDATEHREPEAAAKQNDGQSADVNGCELHVGRHPSPEQLNRIAVSLAIRDVLDTPRFDGRDLRAVFPLPNGYLRVEVSGCRHSPLPISPLHELPASV